MEAGFASPRDVIGWRGSPISLAIRKKYGSFRKHWKSHPRLELHLRNWVRACTSIGGRTHLAIYRMLRSVPPLLIPRSFLSSWVGCVRERTEEATASSSASLPALHLLRRRSAR